MLIVLAVVTVRRVVVGEIGSRVVDVVVVETLLRAGDSAINHKRLPLPQFNTMCQSVRI